MTVIVSIDGSAGTGAAIRLAAREARYRDSPLLAIGAYGDGGQGAAPAARPPSTLHTPADRRSAAAARVRDAVAQALGPEAGDVRCEVIQGLAGRRFVQAARDAGAELIVLSARGTMSLLLGAVSQYVLRHAPCPVLVVPDGAPAG